MTNRWRNWLERESQEWWGTCQICGYENYEGRPLTDGDECPECNAHPSITTERVKMMEEQLLECPNCHTVNTHDAWNDATTRYFKAFNIEKTTDRDAASSLFACPYCGEEIGGHSMILKYRTFLEPIETKIFEGVVNIEYDAGEIESICVNNVDILEILRNGDTIRVAIDILGKADQPK